MRIRPLLAVYKETFNKHTRIMSTQINTLDFTDSADPFNLATYTEAFKQRTSNDDAFRASIAAWTRFTNAHPLLYLPDRSPNKDFDALDSKRQLWTHQQLHAFGDVVANRTQRILVAQEQLLRDWHYAATQIQKCVRALLARRRVKRLLIAGREMARNVALVSRYRSSMKRRQRAAGIIQRCFRRHIAYMIYKSQCCVRLQRASRLFLFRCHRTAACRVIQRVFRLHLFRLRVLHQARVIVRMIRKSREYEQLQIATAAFQRAHESKHQQHQQLLWEKHPVAMTQFRRMQQRKHQAITMRRRMVEAEFAPRGLPKLPVHESTCVKKVLPTEKPQWQKHSYRHEPYTQFSNQHKNFLPAIR